MKKRPYNQIKFTRSGKKMVMLGHLVGEMSVTTCGGGYILPVPCGAGKSTGIVSLVVLYPAEGFVIFVKTKAECRDMYDRLRIAGVADDEITMIYSPTKEEELFVERCDNPFDMANIKIIAAVKRAKAAYATMMESPAELTTKRVLIITSQHLYTNFLPALFAYTAKKTPLDLHQYIGKTKELLKSLDARKFIIIDEQPDFIQNFISVNGRTTASHFGVLSSKSSDVAMGKYFLHPEPLDMMKCRYDNLLSTPRSCFFFGRRCELNRLKSFEFLHHLHSNFSAIAQKRSYALTTKLNDLISTRGVTSNIYLFDATADVLSSYKTSNFRLIAGDKARYCSPIKFSPFNLDLKRWYSESKMKSAKLSEKLDHIADTLENQIRSLGGEKLLIVTWKYMSIKGKDETIGIMKMLEERLDTKGLNGLYSIIYRGSGEDKATNAYRDYAGVTFLGEWLVKGSLTPLNKNFNIKSSEHKLRLSGMVQTVCRVRIRKHDGEPIKIFYSEDIDRKLMIDLQQYFRSHSDKGVVVEGVPVEIPSSRDDRFISEMRKLIKYNPALLSGIIDRKGYTLSIPLVELVKLLPKGNKVKSSYRHFKTRLQTEYKIKLEIK
ncbi:MAG: hypothetical protein SNF93_04250 [Rikenellaceae bacterium]